MAEAAISHLESTLIFPYKRNPCIVEDAVNCPN